MKHPRNHNSPDSHELEEIEQRIENIEALLQQLVNLLLTPSQATELILSFAQPTPK
jgi:hypothetical protein